MNESIHLGEGAKYVLRGEASMFTVLAVLAEFTL
jgi:hypothetical protein